MLDKKLGVLLAGLLCLLLAAGDTTAAEDKVPVLAKFLGFIDPPCQARDSFVRGNHCYVAGGLGGIVILDVTDPKKPKQVGQLPIDGFAWKIELYDNLAFIAGYDGGFHIYELTAPTTFALRGSCKTKGKVFDFVIKEHYAFLADGENGLTVLDIQNPSAPNVLANAPCANKAYSVAVDGNRAYLACGVDGTHIYDITNPSTPKLLSKFNTDYMALEVSARDNYIYVSDNLQGLVAVDVRDGAHAKAVGNIPLSKIDNPWVNGKIRGNYLYGACLYGGLIIVDISQPEQIKIVGRSNTSGQTGSDYARSFGVFVKGNYAYMSTFYAPRKYRGLQILELDKKLCPEKVEADPKLPFVPATDPLLSVPDMKTFQPLLDKHQETIAKGAELANVKIDKLNFSLTNALGGPQYRLSAIEENFSHPFNLEKYAYQQYTDYAKTGNSIEAFLKNSVEQHGKWKGVSEGNIPEWSKESPEKNFARLYELENEKLPDKEARDITTKLARFPQEIQQAIGVLAAGTSVAIKLRREAFGKLTDEDWQILLNAQNNPWENQRRVVDIALARVDFSKLYGAALTLGQAVDFAAPLLQKGAAKLKDVTPQFELETPCGLICVGGIDDNAWNKDALLIVDLGGNDIYVNNAGGSSLSPSGVSLVVDISGEDSYFSRKNFVQGAGVIGIGFLVDFEGDDIYGDDKSFSFTTQGAAILGVGLLWDKNGNDKYNGGRLSQGAGILGLGLLHDGGGNDAYLAYESAQGFGEFLGLGVLMDCNGNDKYVAGDLIPDCIRLKPDFASFCQGAGHGNREVKHSKEEGGWGMAGGIGMLLDLAGNDTYSAGGFAQGTAYWDALGILIDVSGNDSYQANEYAMGGCVHYGAAGHFDFSGNDSYRILGGFSMGMGKDYSIGVHVDNEGDDSYEACDFSMGSVMGSGVGLCIDNSGNDTYRQYSHFPGIADISSYGGEKDNISKAFAVFIDLAGKDNYQTHRPGVNAITGDEKNWTQGKCSAAIDVK